MLSIVALTRTLQDRPRSLRLYRSAEGAAIAAAAFCLAIGLTDWGAKATLAAMVVLLLLPVGAGIFVWAKHPTLEGARDRVVATSIPR